MNYPLVIIILYVICLYAIGYVANRLASKGGESFILAGRRLSTPLVAVAITGLAIGGASTIGVAEQAYQVGFAAGWYNAAWAAGAILMGLFAAARYREMNIATVPEMFERFYDVKGRVICVISQIFIQLTITSLQYIAGGAILASLLPDIFSFRAGMIISAVVFISITFIGGLWMAGLANLLNVVLIYLGISLVAFATVFRHGGLSGLAAQLPEDVPYLHLVDGLGWAVIAGWFAVMITQSLSTQAVVQISFGARNARVARNGFIWGGILMVPIGFLSAATGIAAKVSFPDISATMALPAVIMSLNPVVAGITLAALWAADVSSACNLLLGSATLFSNDIYKRFVNPQVDDKTFMRVTRATVAVLGLTTFFMALTVAGILKTLLIGLSLTTAFTVVFLFTVFLPALCRKNAAFYTTLAGIAVLVLWQLVPAIRVVPHVIYLQWIVCCAVFLLTLLFDPRSANAAPTPISRTSVEDEPVQRR